jgi:hypothetical protein
MEPDTRTLSCQQAYEAAYRYIAQYYEHERIKPILRLVESTRREMTRSDPGAWKVWKACVQQTLEGSPLPEIPQPWE